MWHFLVTSGPLSTVQDKGRVMTFSIILHNTILRERNSKNSENCDKIIQIVTVGHGRPLMWNSLLRVPGAAHGGESCSIAARCQLELRSKYQEEHASTKRLRVDHFWDFHGWLILKFFFFAYFTLQVSNIADSSPLSDVTGLFVDTTYSIGKCIQWAGLSWLLPFFPWL